MRRFLGTLNKGRLRQHFAAVCAFMVLAVVQPSYAAVVLQMSTQEMASHAEGAFHGVVTNTSSRWTDDKQAIVTDVTFRIIESMKGDLGREVTLVFTGGSVDGLTLSMSGLQIPQVGEEGIYFVESMASQQASPIVGWNQGHFRIAQVQDQTRVLTAEWEVVSHLDLQVLPSYGAFNETRSSGVQLGDAQPLSVDAFKAQMLKVLAAGEVQ